MIPLVKHYLIAFFFDEHAAARFLRGLGGLVGTAGLTVIAFGSDRLLAMSMRELVGHGVVALGGALFAMLPSPSIPPPVAPEAPRVLQ